MNMPNRMTDLARQGFMKPRVKRMVTKYRVWAHDAAIGDYVSGVHGTLAGATRGIYLDNLAGSDHLRIEKFKELE